MELYTYFLCTTTVGYLAVFRRGNGKSYTLHLLAEPEQPTNLYLSYRNTDSQPPKWDADELTEISKGTDCKV